MAYAAAHEIGHLLPIRSTLGWGSCVHQPGRFVKLHHLKDGAVSAEFFVSEHRSAVRDSKLLRSVSRFGRRLGVIASGCLGLEMGLAHLDLKCVILVGTVSGRGSKRNHVVSICVLNAPCNLLGYVVA
jgi:hypothetical protein